VARLDRETGALDWLANVCEAMASGGSNDAPMFNLLTLGDSLVYYCTNLGTVAALDRRTGKIAWAASYTRRSPVLSGPLSEQGADLNPCVVHRGRVYALPRDAYRVLCFDAATGAPLWESARFSGYTHLLGVIDGKLIVTGGQTTAFDSATGKIAWRWPANSVPSYGRGVLAGGLVYWPTPMDIHVLKADDGALAQPAIDMFSRFGQRPGNLLAAAGKLLVAQPDRLVAMGPARNLLERYRKEIVADPRAAEPHYRMGELLSVEGRWRDSADAFARAASRAVPGQIVDGRPLPAAAASRRFQALLDAALHAPSAETPHAFDAACAAAPAPRDRLRALEAEAKSAAPARKLELAWKVLGDSALAPLPSGEDSSSTAKSRAASWMHAAVAHPEVRRTYERALEDELAKPENRDGARLAQLAERFPVGDAAATIQRQSAAAKSRGNDWQGARRDWAFVTRKSRTVEPSDLASLAECHRRLGDLDAATVLEATVARLAKTSMPTLPTERPRFAKRETQAGFECRADGADRTSTSASFVWNRSDRRLRSADNARTLGDKPFDAVDWIGRTPYGVVVAQGGELAGFSEADGKALWSATLEGARQWPTTFSVAPPFDASKSPPPRLGRDPKAMLALGESILVLDRTGLSAFDALDGVLRWKSSLDSGAAGDRLEAVGGLAFVVGSDRLRGFDPWTGQVVVNVEVAPNAGGETPIAAGSIVVAVASRAAVEAFDARDGRRIWQATFGAPMELPPRVFAGLEDVFVLIDGARLAALDPQTGKVRWDRWTSDGSLGRFGGSVFGGRDAVFAALGDELQKRRRSDGALEWRRPLALPLDDAPIELALAGAESGVEVRALRTGAVFARFDGAGERLP
jgi:outer membrane protein assembly factor BamB